MKVFSHFLLKFFRFNYKLLWKQQDQNAYINFPQVLTETELPPIIISKTNKHIHYRDPTSFNITYFELIIFDNNFIIEHSKTSDNRPNNTSSLISETLLDEYNPNISQHDTGQNILHPNQDDTLELFQNQETPEFNIIPDPQQITTTLQDIPDPSETATIQNVSELSDETTKNRQSIIITNDSNILQTPVYNITQNSINDQTPNDAI